MGDEQGDSSALMNGLVETMNGSAGDLSGESVAGLKERGHLVILYTYIEPPSETVTPPRGALLGVCSKKLFQGWAFKELIALCRLAVPIVSHLCPGIGSYDVLSPLLQILTFIFQQLPVILSLFFVGHITGRALELDSAGMCWSLHT